jgi:hypothetical protein
LYHEKRIALVNNFVCLVPLKNIVQGRKGYLKVEKRFPWESSFPLFYPWERSFFVFHALVNSGIKIFGFGSENRISLVGKKLPYFSNSYMDENSYFIYLSES